MLELLSILHDTILQIAATNSTNLVPQDLASQVSGNSTAVNGTLAGVVIAGGGVVLNALRSRQNNTKIATTGSEIDRIVLSDIIDNYNDFRLWLNIEKMIQDQSVLHPDYPYAKLLSLVYDVSTGETLGQKRAKYIVQVNNYYTSYYENTNNKKTIDDLSKKPLESTLNYVKDKTSPS
jgi:hypothetical protein